MAETIIGIHDGHNSSACYVNNGEVINLIQEERLVNEKNYFGTPIKSINKLLEIKSRFKEAAFKKLFENLDLIMSLTL